MITSIAEKILGKDCRIIAKYARIAIGDPIIINFLVWYSVIVLNKLLLLLDLCGLYC